MTASEIPPLPRSKTAVQVLVDFLQYLHRCSRLFIEKTHANGATLWQSVEATAEYVLSHPNEWKGDQQHLLRETAIMAGLVPDTEDGRSRIFFVEEGRAILHFCIDQGLASEVTV